MSDEQRAVTHDLDTACQRHRVVLLWVPNTRWTEREMENGTGDYVEAAGNTGISRVLDRVLQWEKE